MKLFLYSHTHWDREWYLSQNQFQYRLIRTLDEIIDILAEDNVFNTFVLDGQTSVVEDYLELRPERREVINELIRTGKFVIGPWFTMPDMFIPDGESLIRNLLRGWQDCRQFGAVFPNTGYVPDSFGHIEQMPQIMQGMGIDNYIFSRGLPVSLSDRPGFRREFLWEGPDGTRLYAWPLGSLAYTAGMFLPGPDEPEKLRDRLEQAIQWAKASSRNDVALLPHGIDHTWLQRDIPQILEAVPDLLPGVEVHHGTLQAALDEWKKAVPADLETYRGQLRGRLTIHELHGTLSSRVDNKIMNEHAQMHIENLAEPLQAIAHMFGRSATPWFFRKAWRLIFHNHAHDSICGCSQDRVHADVNRRFREVIELGIDIADGALDYLNNPARRDRIPTAIIYAGLNGGNHVVDFVIRLAEKPTGACCFTDAAGADYPIQWTALTPLRVQHTNGNVEYWECRGCVYIPDPAPCEVRKLVFCPERAAPPPHYAAKAGEANMLSNGLISVRVNSNGTLDLRDPVSGACVHNTHYVAQEGDQGGGYHFEPVLGDHRRDTRSHAAAVRLVENGPLRAILEIATALRVPAKLDRRTGKRTGQRTLPIRTVLTLEAGSPLIKCRTNIVNSAKNQRLRLILPTQLTTRKVHADASFAVHENDAGKWPAEAGQNFHPMRNFVTIADDSCGFTFMGKGLHEYEIVPTDTGTQVEVTLLRSVDFVLQCCTWETPEAQLTKALEFEYALTLHRGNWRDADIPGLTAAFRNPAIALVHGDFAGDKEQEPHATIGYYIKEGSAEVPVDSNRSTWKMYNADRDGWRRVEPGRFVHESFDGRVAPFSLEGRDLVVSAFKDSEDGTGRILRFWSCAAAPQTVTVRSSNSETCITRTNLLEQPLPGTKTGEGKLEVPVKPFEIVTLLL